jgi:hypothetical protein
VIVQLGYIGANNSSGRGRGDGGTLTMENSSSEGSVRRLSVFIDFFSPLKLH